MESVVIRDERRRIIFMTEDFYARDVKELGRKDAKC